MKKTITTLFSIAAVISSSQAATVITSDGQVVDGVTVNIGSDWVYETPAAGEGGWEALQSTLSPGPTQTISFSNIPANMQVLLQILPTDDNSNGNPRTWDGVLTTGGAVQTGGTFTADAGVWTDNTTSLVSGVITGLSFEGTAQSIIDGSPNGVPSGAAWGSADILGATSVTYSVVNDGGRDNYNFCVSVVPVPEPSSTALLGLGVLTLATRRKR